MSIYAVDEQGGVQNQTAIELPHIRSMCRDRTTIHSHSILTITAVRACHNTTMFQIDECIAFDEVDACAVVVGCGNACILETQMPV